MIFRNILEVLEQELQSRKDRARQNYDLFAEVQLENKRLKEENEMLRKDLAELSKEHFKK
jgi:hypothetical protein